MPISIPSHGNPEKKVFGLIGQSITTDESAVYSKRDGDKLNIGWENVIPSQTPTNTATPTPTVSPTRTPTPTPVPSVALTTTPTLTPTATPTPTPTVTVTGTPSVTSTPGGSPTATPTVTPTSSPPAGTPPATPTNTPTISVTPSSGAAPTPTPTVTSTVTNTPTPTVTSTPSTTPTSTPPTTWTLSVSSFAVNSGPSGQTPGGTGPTGGGTYNNGDIATVSITPDSNTDGTLYIDAVSIGQVAGTTSLSTGVTMNANRSAQANWSWKNVQWNMGILGGGSGTATGPGGSAGPGNVQKLATISILATIDFGYRFVSWTCIEGGVTFGSTTSASTTATLTTDGAHSIRATIVPLSYYIEGNRNDDGLLNFTYYDVDGNLQEYYNFDPGNPGGYVYPAACGTQIGTQIAGSANLSGIGC